jgi:hypothetical protein
MHKNILTPDDQSISLLLNDTVTLKVRLFNLHKRILSKGSIIDRIACAIYNTNSDEISTFISSTLKGCYLENYSTTLSQSHQLSEIATSVIPRAIEDIPAALT